MSTLAPDEASDLKQDLETVARLELGETPEVKRDSLAELHRLLEEDDELRVPPDDDFLLMFLRTRKYNVAEAQERIKRYFRARKKMPEYFEELTTSSALYETVFREHKLIMYAGERDPMGRVASVTNYGAWNSNICSITELLRCGLWAMECSLLEEETQIRGFVAAIDLKGFSTHHLMQMTPWFLARVISIAQLHFIGSDLSQLCGALPSELIPEEFGGTRDTFDYARQERFCKEKESHFDRIRQFGYKS